MKRFLITALTAASCIVPFAVQAQEAVTVYSSRIEQLIKPLFDRYTAETGIKINLLTDRGGSLAERLAAEGTGSPADVLLTVDMGNLWAAAERGLLRKIDSNTLNENVPVSFRDPGNRWWGLSRRERTIFFDPSKVKASELSTYEELADPKWKGKLCLRTSKQTYTQSLVAMLLVKHGTEKTEKIVKGWVDNLATDVFTNDSSMLKAVAAGQCPVAIANTYYYGRLTANDEAFKSKVSLFWAAQGKDEGGVHVNLSGGGVTQHAKNPVGAQKLLEWLSSEAAQNGYTHGTFESPVNPKVAPDAIIQSWGTSFTPSPLNASDIGSRQAEAIRLLDRVGYR